MTISGGRLFKTLWESAWHVPGTVRRLLWLKHQQVRGKVVGNDFRNVLEECNCVGPWRPLKEFGPFL